MGTRSSIGFVQPNGRVIATYCHWDGYPEGVGSVLLKHYNTAQKAEAVAKVGYLSSLDSDLEFSKKEAANKAEPERHASPDAFFKAGNDSWCEWGYLFKDGRWYVGKFGGGAGPGLVSAFDPEGKTPSNFQPLESVLLDGYKDFEPEADFSDDPLYTNAAEITRTLLAKGNGAATRQDLIDEGFDEVLVHGISAGLED